MAKVTICVAGQGHIPAGLMPHISELAEEMADAMEHVAQSMILCTCVAYLCVEHREDIEEAIMSSVTEEMGHAVSNAVSTAVREAQAAARGQSYSDSRAQFDDHIRQFMFAVRSACERYINDNGLEVKTGTP